MGSTGQKGIKDEQSESGQKEKPDSDDLPGDGGHHGADGPGGHAAVQRLTHMRKERKRLSFGTVFMLMLTLLVLAASAGLFLWTRTGVA